MEFFDPKEDVLDITITPYGKWLLSKGRFKPAYYQFFDGDIIYDGNFASFNDRQSDLNARIKEVPRTKAQPTFSGRETQNKKNIELVRSGQEKDIFSSKFLPTAEKFYSLSAPLGSGYVGTGSIPAWDIKVLKGEISGAVAFITGSLFPTSIIPKIILNPVEYKTFVNKDGVGERETEIGFQDKGTVGINTDLNFANKRFDDGTFIQVVDDYILLDIKEENVDLKKENFEIEVFLVDKDTSFDGINQESLIPLYFEKKKTNIVNNILIDDQNMSQGDTDLDPSFVSHFFNVFVDHEINPDILCQNLSEDERRSLGTEFTLDCEDLTLETLTTPKSTSDVTESDIEKDKC